MMFQLPVLVSALGVLTILTGGCAFGVRHAVITYPPEPRTAKTTTNDPPAGLNRRIAVLPFADERKNKENVGYVLNGFGMRTASVVCDNPDLSQVVTDAVRTALKNSGYDVVNASAQVSFSEQVVSCAS